MTYTRPLVASTPAPFSKHPTPGPLKFGLSGRGNIEPTEWSNHDVENFLSVKAPSLAGS